MELAEILRRVESRLKELGMSARAASIAAGKPDAVRNLKRAIKSGHRQGVSTATISALAPVLKTSVTWLMTGQDRKGDEISVDLLEGALSQAEAITLLTWVLEAVAGAPTHEARVLLARAVVRAVRTPPSPGEEPLSESDKRALVLTAIRLFRA